MSNFLACFLALQALCLCRALPPCPKFKCSVNCEFGHASDRNGCPTCQCRDACSVFSETPLCPKGQQCSNDPDSPKGYKCIQMQSSGESCDLTCEFGFLKDKTGCNVCECKPNPCDNVTCFEGKTCVVNLTLPLGYECTLTGHMWCSDVMCDLFCEYGFETDLAGCDVCMCRKEPCVGPLCPLPQRENHEEPGPLVACDPRIDKNCKPECPLVTCPCSIYQLDSIGCQTCDCPPTDSKTTPEPVECMPLTCLCPEQKEGSDGCPVCDCPYMTSTTTEPAILTDPILTAVVCFQVTCTCSNYKFDSKGCRDCDCPDISTTTPNPVTCVQVTCRCPNYKYDSKGCRDCDCPDIITITPTSPASKCPNFQCLIYCEFGFVRNSLGCKICQCRSDPCKNKMCSDNEICQADDSVQGYVCIPQGHIWCSEEGCELICESGYERDENGCDICKCKEVICNGYICPNGFECGEVTHGCKTQTCDPIVEQMCVKVKPCD